MAMRSVSLRLIATLVGLVCLAAVVYLSYELGRYQAGYAIMDVRRDSARRDGLISQQALEIEDLERQIAILETAREVDRETYAQVEANLKQLEQKIQSQEAEVAFYQGIVSPEDGASGLRIQSFSIEPAGGERSFSIQLVLVQAIVQTQRVTGRVKLSISGRDRSGARGALDLPALGVDSTEARYGFRYFQTLGFDVTLPPGFVAESVDVEVEPTEPRGPVVAESYTWAP